MGANFSSNIVHNNIQNEVLELIDKYQVWALDNRQCEKLNNMFINRLSIVDDIQLLKLFNLIDKSYKFKNYVI